MATTVMLRSATIRFRWPVPSLKNAPTTFDSPAVIYGTKQLPSAQKERPSWPWLWGAPL